MASPGHDHDLFERACVLSIKRLRDGGRHADIVFDGDEQNRPRAHPPHRLLKVKFGRLEVRPPGRPRDHFIGERKGWERGKPPPVAPDEMDDEVVMMLDDILKR